MIDRTNKTIISATFAREESFRGFQPGHSYFLVVKGLEITRYDDTGRILYSDLEGFFSDWINVLVHPENSQLLHTL